MSTSNVRKAVLHLSPQQQHRILHVHRHQQQHCNGHHSHGYCHHHQQQQQHRHGHFYLRHCHGHPHHQQQQRQQYQHGFHHLRCHCHQHHHPGHHYQHQQLVQRHCHGHRNLLRRHQHQMRAMRAKEEEGLLWEDLFSKPSQWLDYRQRKRTPSHPDFRHKTSRAPLWLNSLYKPHWVDSRLAVPGPGTPHEEDLLSSLCHKGELNMAMDALSHMDENGFTPSDTLYISLLKACHKAKSLFHAVHVHAHVRQHRMQVAGPLRDALIITLAKCGGLEEVHGLLSQLPHCTAYPWTAIISGYVECGRGQDALDTFYYMREIGVEPNHYTFASVFKACSSVGDLEEGRKLHIHVQNTGLALTPSIGTALVSMYSKCGSILEAESVFKGLPQRDVFSWNAMLSAYLEHGFWDKVLLTYRQMQEERENLDALTYMIVLQACGLLGQEDSFYAPNNRVFLVVGRGLHADMRRRNFLSDVLLGSALVSMYCKCGFISEAMSVLEALSERDITSWSALLSAYVQQGQGANALLVHKKLLEEGLSPDLHIFVTSLRACIVLLDKEETTTTVPLEIGKALHEDAQCKGLASDVFFGNTLVSMYGKCGSIARAEIVFKGLCHRDVVSWNAVLSVYIQHGLGANVLCLYRQMLEEGVFADALTFVICFQACGLLTEHEDFLSKQGNEAKPISLQIGQALHAVVRQKGYCSSALVCNGLISMYGKCRSLVEAENVFSSFEEHDVVSWNSMLSAYVENGKGRKALLLYKRMQDGFENPNKLTYVIALQACSVLTEEEGQFCEVMALDIGRALHADLWMKSFLSDVVVGSTLVSMYGKCGAVEDAEIVFDRLLHRNLVLWNSMLSAYVEQGHGDKALHLYGQMEQNGMPEDEITLVCALQACSKTGTFEMCGQIYFKILSVGFGSSPNLVNTVIHSYGHCASRLDAQAVFFYLAQADQVAWNAWIASYAQEGSFEGSISVFQEMQMANIRPDVITYLSLLYACSHVGLVEGLEFLESMRIDYHLSPDIKHYVVMIDLLGRTGNFKNLEYLLSKMPMQANLPLWLCLLGACRMHGNVKLGKEAFKHAMDLEPGDAAAYVLLSNIYADGCLQE